MYSQKAEGGLFNVKTRNLYPRPGSNRHTFSDKDFTYTDATSFALMERIDIMKVFTFDQHFAQYGFEIVV